MKNSPFTWSTLICSLFVPTQAYSEEVRVALSWLRNGQYAPLMVADAKGFFAEKGIEISLIDGGPGKNAPATVGAGQAEFGIGAASFVFSARQSSTPIDLIAVGAFADGVPLSYIRLSEPGAAEPTPTDMEGKTVGVQAGGEYFLEALMTAAGADYSKVNVKNVLFSAEPLMLGQVDYYAAFITNQPYQIDIEKQKANPLPNVAGKQWQAVKFSDYVSYSSDVIFTTGSIAKENPELVQRFLAAAEQGLAYYLENQKEALELVLNYPDQIEDEAKLNWRFPIQNAFHDDELKMDEAGWTEAMTFFHKAGQIESVLAVEEVMTNEFLD